MISVMFLGLGVEVNVNVNTNVNWYIDSSIYSCLVLPLPCSVLKRRNYTLCTYGIGFS